MKPGRHTYQPNNLNIKMIVVFLLIILAVGFILGFIAGRLAGTANAAAHGWEFWNWLEKSEDKTGEPDARPAEEQGAAKIDKDSWQLKLVSEKHPLPEDYSPQLQEVEHGYRLDERAAPALKDMLAAMRAQGLSPVICSAYRTYGYQAKLHDANIRKHQREGHALEAAKMLAVTEVARPGHSEHNLGLAVDIVSESYQSLDEGYADTPEARWLRDNCHQYGFILRYPKEKQSVTGVTFEPWHFRYVGVEHAGAIMQGGLCLEEYLDEP